MGAGSPEKTVFAQSLGVAVEELPAVGALFSAVMARAGVNGDRIFAGLSEGKSMREALAVPEEAVPVIYARAHSWFSIGRVDKALVLFRGLCALAPDVADHWVGLGVCFKSLDRFEESARALESAAVRRPDWALPYLHLVEVHLRAGDRTGAAAALAAFDARPHDHIPALLKQEVERFRAALAARPPTEEARGLGVPPA
jgi:tetratricopeptide (TPR) repeat protein